MSYMFCPLVSFTFEANWTDHFRSFSALDNVCSTIGGHFKLTASRPTPQHALLFKLQGHKTGLSRRERGAA